MRGGFTFCGVDIADLGLEYAPESEDFYQFRPASSASHEELFDGHDGGYYYGFTVGPKEFKLRCYFEGRNIYKGLLSQIFHVFRKGNTGRLIFQERPWCYYLATVTDDADTSGLISSSSGILTFHLKAYVPFGRCDTIVCARSDPYYTDIMQNTAVPEKEEMLPELSFDRLPETVLILNPGTEYAPLSVSVAGDAADGIIIENKTTGQKMELSGFTKEDTSEHNPERWIHCDSFTGKTTVQSATESRAGFLYHKSGFLQLAPGYPAIRDLFVSCDGGHIVRFNKMIYGDYRDKYIYLAGEWRKIQDHDTQSIILYENAPAVSEEKTMIVSMNEITLTAVNGADITKLEFDFTPAYS